MTHPLLPCMSAFWALRVVAADDAQGSDSRSRLEVTGLVSKRYARLLADICRSNVDPFQLVAWIWGARLARATGSVSCGEDASAQIYVARLHVEN